MFQMPRAAASKPSTDHVPTMESSLDTAMERVPGDSTTSGSLVTSMSSMPINASEPPTSVVKGQVLSVPALQASMSMLSFAPAASPDCSSGSACSAIAGQATSASRIGMVSAKTNRQKNSS